MTTQRRLLRELNKIQGEHSNQFSISIDGKDIMTWNVTLFGPEKTEWEGGVFPLTFEFPPEYPHKPPAVKFTKVIPFHPNVYNNGKICIDILQHNWSSAYGVTSIITSILALLGDPNPNSPANNEAAELYTHQNQEYIRRVKQVVESTWQS